MKRLPTSLEKLHTVQGKLEQQAELLRKRRDQLARQQQRLLRQQREEAQRAVGALVESLGISLADLKALETFLTWALESYPHQHYITLCDFPMSNTSNGAFDDRRNE